MRTERLKIAAVRAMHLRWHDRDVFQAFGRRRGRTGDTQLEIERPIRKDPARDGGAVSACLLRSHRSTTIKRRRGPGTSLSGKLIKRALRGCRKAWSRPQLWIHHQNDW